jgi:hypothetical protein
MVDHGVILSLLELRSRRGVFQGSSPLRSDAVSFGRVTQDVSYDLAVQEQPKKARILSYAFIGNLYLCLFKCRCTHNS